MTELNLDGYTDLPLGKLAAVVTNLDMRERPSLAEPTPRITLRRVERPDLGWYRALYRAIGEDWLWFSRIEMNETDLAGILHRQGNETYVAVVDGEEVGIVELDRRDPADVEISFFGLRPGATGKGLGGAMMTEALRLAWHPGTLRVWLHTCTLDHPAALTFYRRCGFTPFARSVEVVDDPRLSGVLPRAAAPHIPIIG
jgi:GNAT superfamily N-acetyltransferase